MCSSHGVFACTFGGICAILQKAARLSRTVLLLQLIPARGRKRKIATANHHLAVATYPREGTETPDFGSVGEVTIVATYPREGTETPFAIKLASFIMLQLIPARGRKLLKLLTSFQIKHSLQLIPARGRKPPALRHLVDGHGCNLSPRGDGNSNAFASMEANMEAATYPREGPETGA